MKSHRDGWRRTRIAAAIAGMLAMAHGTCAVAPAQNSHSVISQDSYGFALQLSVTGKVAGMENQLTAGLSGDFANTGFA
ncbi:hypothetical protein P3T43_005803 [Paraburkholderia sp. GAS41]|jgi:iron complex outermembrane receptor protein|uniref:hypothetical protein n=1 Tax=Paraburkholderia sp. GAS41 TaxID=3035134 RepID=UPI003D1ABCF2